MSMNIKLSKAQISKLLKSGASLKALGNVMGKLGKKLLWHLDVPLVKEVLPKSAAKATSSVLDKLERKISGKGAARTGRQFTLFISNENMDDIKIIE